ncbi:unnamed protein product [Lasius platythorax]|uniref:Uncharacterized protein n=1 Tax=Lasius platythorax TaxID=488582 RepID=A0AAV2NWH8_9HYME
MRDTREVEKSRRAIEISRDREIEESVTCRRLFARWRRLSKVHCCTDRKTDVRGICVSRKVRVKQVQIDCTNPTE